MISVDMGTWHTYVDWTTEPEPRPFYVGKGNDARIKGLLRNEHHAAVARRHGLQREVVLTTSLEDVAHATEVELIAEHRTFVDDPSYNGVGCNHTPGGEGHVPSAALRQEYSRRMKARWDDPARRSKLASSMRGRKHKSGPRPLQSIAMRGSRNPNYGRPMPEERKEKLRRSKRGVPSPLRGRKVPENVVAKRMKPVLVTDEAASFCKCFVSHKAAAEYVGQRLGISPRTVLCYMIVRTKEFRGFTFAYPGDA